MKNQDFFKTKILDILFNKVNIASEWQGSSVVRVEES